MPMLDNNLVKCKTKLYTKIRNHNTAGMYYILSIQLPDSCTSRNRGVDYFENYSLWMNDNLQDKFTVCVFIIQ